MASACVNSIGMSPESFLDCAPGKYPAFGWLSPRHSFSHELAEEEVKIVVDKASKKSRVVTGENDDVEENGGLDPEVSVMDFVDFEFRLGNPDTMLPADELFSDGKLMPLHVSSSRQVTVAPPSCEVSFADTPKFLRRSKVSSMDPYLFSPKAPRCSSRWKEILGLKKLYQNSNGNQEDRKTAPTHGAAKSLKQFLHRGNRSSSSTLNSSIDSSLNFPLLKDLDNESLSISSRLSLSSSSSSHDHDDLPRLSLDSDKPSAMPRNRNISRSRVSKHRSSSSETPAANRAGRNSVLIRKTSESTITAAAAPATVLAVESPRMNSSGKIVFHGLERSSSSPSSSNCGSRYKNRAMERSYSANVRVTPVLNVPVCSFRAASKSGVFGFPMFSSHQKKDNNGSGNGTHQFHSKNRTDRS